MINHQNGLRVVDPLANHPRHTAALYAAELSERFSFQPWSESADEDSASTRRQAVMAKHMLEEIYERLAMQKHLDTRNLRLRASNGIVTIEGFVTDHAMRAGIGHFIRHCPLVRSVINRLQVRSVECAATAATDDSNAMAA